MTVDIGKIRVGEMVTVGPFDVIRLEGGSCVLKDGNATWSHMGADKIVEHIPAIRSWSEIENKLVGVVATSGGAPIDVATRIITLLNKIAPRGVA